MTEALIVVPCRAGSVEVPRKNLQIVDGVPLISRTLNMLADVGEHTPVTLTVVVSTNDPVVAELAAQHGVIVHRRTADLCGPDVTTAAVVDAVAEQFEWDGVIGCAQVTSPWLSPWTVAEMITVFADTSGPSWWTASTVVPEKGLRWLLTTKKLIGDVTSRQTAGDVTARETGGLRLWSSRANVLRFPVGSDQHLHWTVDEVEGLDVDTPLDLAIARVAGERSRILFVVEASDLTGSGHVHRVATLADHLSQHHLEVAFVEDPPEWAWRIVETHAGFAKHHKSWRDLEVTPDAWDCVVFDKLDTTLAEVGMARAFGASCVSLEDNGPGAALCDVTINELLPGSTFAGPAWSVLRPEFCGPAVPAPIGESSTGHPRVLVTFGGTDPAGLNQWAADVLAGAGYQVTVMANPASKGGGVEGGTWVKSHEVPMAKAMREADVVVTSRGRTVTEAMAMGRPVVSIAANVRELEHWHHPAVKYLGMFHDVTDAQLVAAVEAFDCSPEVIGMIGSAFRSAVDGRGAERVARIIHLAAHGD